MCVCVWVFVPARELECTICMQLMIAVFCSTVQPWSKRRWQFMHLNNEHVMMAWANGTTNCANLHRSTNKHSKREHPLWPRPMHNKHIYIQFPDNFNSCKFKAIQITCTTSSFFFLFFLLRDDIVCPSTHLCGRKTFKMKSEMRCVCVWAGETNACTMQTHNTGKWTEKLKYSNGI